MNSHWTELKMHVQGRIPPPKSYSSEWDDDWEQDERYYMYTQDTGDYNELAKNSLENMKETIQSFKELGKKHKIPEKEIKEHCRLLTIARNLHEKTRNDNLWNRDCPNDYKKCMNVALDLWEHYYRILCIVKEYD